MDQPKNKQQAVKVKVSKRLSLEKEGRSEGEGEREGRKMKEGLEGRNYVACVSTCRHAYTLIILLSNSSDLKKIKSVVHTPRTQICIFFKNSKRGP